VKHNEQRNPKKKTFLRIPTFPGGKSAFQNFIKENVIYPEEALLNKIEGLVFVKYTVNNIGEVVDVEVTKGIGFGCDEEAIRVIRLMTYEPARNRGVKMKVEMKTRFHFKLPQIVQPETQAGIQIKYSTTTPEQTNNPEQKPRAVYNYTINLG
jgi:TonB family protein